MTPSEYFNKSVKGRIVTIDLELKSDSGTVTTLAGGEYDFIDEVLLGGKKAFITNMWAKEYRNEPLIIIAELVKSIELK
jgi:hypothetical protein